MTHIQLHHASVQSFQHRQLTFLINLHFICFNIRRFIELHLYEFWSALVEINHNVIKKPIPNLNGWPFFYSYFEIKISLTNVFTLVIFFDLKVFNVRSLFCRLFLAVMVLVAEPVLRAFMFFINLI